LWTGPKPGAVKVAKTRVRGDLVGGALAAAESGGDQVEGVAAVGLGAGRTAGGPAVIAADQELTGGQGGGVEVVQDGADLAGRRVDVAFGAVAVEADGQRIEGGANLCRLSVVRLTAMPLPTPCCPITAYESA
jgi:hypothetical protein